MILKQAKSDLCCHHWVIQTAEGPLSEGVCRLCHAKREFKNSVESWDRASGSRVSTFWARTRATDRSD